MEFFESAVFIYVLLPLLIFSLRVLDVSMGTIRIIFVAKGYKKIAPLIGFFEMLLWVFAVTRIMQNLDNWLCYVAYAAGFAMGNFVGMILEEKLAIGHELIRVITRKEAFQLIEALREKGFGITTLQAKGMNGKVAVIYIIISRKKVDKALTLINAYNPNALYTIESIRSVNKEIFYGSTHSHTPV